MIKLIVTDVDGVIVGHKKGVNFPYPSQKVTLKMKGVRKKGIPIILCSSKFHSAIDPIIWEADLKNPHITDSGSLIINPIAGKIIHEFVIEKALVSNIIKISLENEVYTEVYTSDNYFVEEDQLCDITPRRTLILQKDPEVSKSLLKTVSKEKVIKILLVARNEAERKKVDNLFKNYKDKATFLWNMHPSTRPFEYCLITSKVTSKPKAVKIVAEKLNIGFENILGIGDTMGDWRFMQDCGYVATMEDAPKDIKRLVKSKGEGKYFIAPSVDEDGMINILDHFIK